MDSGLNVDAVLEQYMLDLEHCTNDLSQAPPILEDLSAFDNLHQPILTASGVDAYADAAQPALDLGLQGEQAAAQVAPQATDVAASRRSEAWTAKNRRAQKRFRERQKVGTAW